MNSHMATTSGFRSSPDTPRPRNDFSPASSSRRPWAEKLSSSSRGGQDAPALGEERKFENDEEKGAEGGKTFPALARSEQSQPASARALLICTLAASPLNFFFLKQLFNKTSSSRKHRSIPKKVLTLKHRRTKRQDFLNWLERKYHVNRMKTQTMRFPPQKTRTSSFVDEKRRAKFKNRTTPV